MLGLSMSAVLISHLDEMGAELREAVGEAIAEGAQEIAERATDLAPRSDSSGVHLQDAIAVPASEEKTDPGVVAWRVQAGDRSAFYGHIVELGGGPPESHQPFLIPALDQKRDRVADLVTEAIKEVA